VVNKMNIYDKFHKAVEIRIGPTFDVIEKVCDRYPRLYPPVNTALFLGLPAWLALAIFVNARREK